MGELFAYADLYGFKSNNPEINMPPLGIFPTPRQDPIPTPGVSLSVQVGPGHHSIDSLHIEELSGDRVKITFYLPGFVRDWDPSLVKVQVYVDMPTPVGPRLIPNGPHVPFSKLTVIRANRHDLMDVTEGAFLIPRPKEGKEVGLVLAQARQHDAFLYEMKFNFIGNAKDSKIAMLENDPGNSFTGLIVNGHVVPVAVSSSSVKLVSCKIHRKSGFVLATVRMIGTSPPVPYISLNKLPKLVDKSPLELVGAMFNEEFGLVKRGVKSIQSLSPLDQIIYNLKDNVKIFLNDVSIAPFTFLNTKALGIIGCVFYHGVYLYPAINSAGSRTPMIDASYAIFALEDVNIAMAIRKSQDQTRQLQLEEKEVEPMKTLLAAFHAHSLDKMIPYPDIVALGAGHIFKRCVIHPLYPLTVKPMFDEMKKTRDASNSARKQGMDVAAALKSGNVEALTSVLKRMGRDPSKMADMQQLIGSMGVSTGGFSG